jgi:hypothetical protein
MGYPIRSRPAPRQAPAERPEIKESKPRREDDIPLSDFKMRRLDRTGVKQA